MKKDDLKIEDALQKEGLRLTDEVREAIRLAIDKESVNLDADIAHENKLIHDISHDIVSYKGSIINELKNSDIFSEINAVKEKNNALKNKKQNFWQKIVNLF